MFSSRNRFIFVFFSVHLFFYSLNTNADYSVSMSSRVVDQTNSFLAKDIAKLDEQIHAMEQAELCQCQALITNIPKDENIAAYSERIFSYLQIGNRDSDNGILIVLDPSRKESRIEVGRGLEGVVTDLKAANILTDVMIPKFKDGKYPQGLLEGFIAIEKLIVADNTASGKLTPASSIAKDTKLVQGQIPWGQVFIVSVFTAFLFVLSLQKVGLTIQLMFTFFTSLIAAATTRDIFCPDAICIEKDDLKSAVDMLFLFICGIPLTILCLILRYSNIAFIVRMRNVLGKFKGKESTTLGGSSNSRQGGGGSTAGGGAEKKW